MAVATPETTEHVTVFFADWCPYCARLRSDLNSSETPYAAIDVDNGAAGNDELNEWIKSVNNGNRVVPTVLYSDGTHATNPPAADVRAKLEELNA
ncbi:MAG: mycoredoxin [Corynebacterium casei]|uniref:Glutaredoxin-like protein n=2 Tax=Corynebacterium casei TaxID=160386 RepID=G7HZ89_9CORY|nr:mycoredoxin [Corynebacterium casei]AHI20598.1 hypothetical protein CCASEI_10215 [Corynebacterium casei LMG S-19264]MDN5707732.1 mycoredoxin [Corynebacterium casei]MDN5730188.1 mycoredoxin [Corynebacterium casei]MDN5741803.1 mycoredoxin [Corynebacterium casei]MDN5784794.1 mycoredoxin [Corynebacterium casei]